MDILMRWVETNKEMPQHIYNELVDEYGNSVYRFCRSLTYSKEDAEDLFQETFLKVLEQPYKLSVSDNPQGFLFSTCTYIWKEKKRKFARRSRLATIDVLDETIASDFSVEDSFIEREENQIIRDLVDSLPEKFRIPIILYYTIEMTLPDIALSLKIPVGTVKSRLHKARKIIKKGLVEHEE